MRAVVILALAFAVAGAAVAAPTGSRRPAPAVSGVTLQGKRVSLQALRGKPVFINVWSSW